MKQILIALELGKDILINTKEKYKESFNKAKDKYDSLLVMKELISNEEKDLLLTRNKTIMEQKQSYVQYINFIINEINKIKSFELCDHGEIFQYNCIYFGNGTLYYDEEFLQYSNKEMFQIILNHIFHYCGTLYFMNYPNIRLSYILASFYICYNLKINPKVGNKIYDEYKNQNDFIIFDISSIYKDFIISNKNIIMTKYTDYMDESKDNLFFDYIIRINQKIDLENLLIEFKENDELESMSFVQISNELKNNVLKNKFIDFSKFEDIC